MMLKEPSKKQIHMANLIHEHFGVPTPEEFSARAYWGYISKYYSEMVEHIKGVHAYNKRIRISQQDSIDRQERWRRQREADWVAIHAKSAWPEYVLDGGQLPSWLSQENPDDFRRYLRSLGYQSSAERCAEHEENMRFGLTGQL